MNSWADLIYGINKKVPTKNGFKPYINLDNAASTPPFKEVLKLINSEAQWYASVHRGSGYKSRYSTEKYENARKSIAELIGVDPSHDVVIFTKNTTDALNKVSHYLPYLPGEFVIYTRLEHHSNELPWFGAKHISLGLKDNQLDLELLQQVLAANPGRIKLLAVSGASNVTGYAPPIDTMAEMAHRAGAMFLVDGAQLAPHRPINIYPPNDPRHIDFFAFSGHKIYAPFGSGVLTGPRWIFEKSPPSQVGGGTVKGIDPSGIIWSDPPEVEEAGSPNVLGAIAMAEAYRILSGLGWENLIKHEQTLLTYTVKRLQTYPEVVLYNHRLEERVGVVSFNIKGIHHQHVADFLGELGIGVRSGCFCARRYVQDLLKLNVNSSESIYARKPGMVRISLGCYNTADEIVNFFKAIEELLRKPGAAGLRFKKN